MSGLELRSALDRPGPWRWLGPLLVLVLLCAVFAEADLPAIPARVGAMVLTAGALLAAWRHRRESGHDPRRDPAILLLVAFLGVLLVTLFSHRHRLWGDAIHSYTYLVSIMEDGDVDFENNARDLSGGEPSATYLQYSIGPAFLWMPGYVVAEIGSRLTGRVPDGWNALYRNAAAAGSLLIGWTGLLALFLSARRTASRASALLAVLAIGGGTFLFGYLAWAPTESHSLTFAGASWLVYWALRCDPLRSEHAFFLGALLGLTTIQRWQAAVMALFVAAVFVRAMSARRSVPWVRPLGACVAGAVLVFLPQAYVWKQVFGAWLVIPQGSGFIDSDLRIEGVLFSPRHGLFSWSPVLYLALPGFLIWARRQPWLCLGAGLAILATVRANAGLVDWSGGSAFGARRFDLTLPFFALALALVFDRATAFVARRPQAVVAVATLLIAAWNLLFAATYFDGRFPNAGPVPFVDQARGVVNQLDAIIGSPFSLPAALYRRATAGIPVTAFEGLYQESRYSTVSIRMGLDDRLFLDDGWSAPFVLDGQDVRRIVGVGAGVVLPIHAPRPYRLGARLRGLDDRSLSVEFWVNDRRVDAFGVTSEWMSHETVVEPEVLRAGRNQLRIVAVRESEEPALAVAGVWFEPGS